MLKKIKEKIDLRLIPAITMWIYFLTTFKPLLIISKYNHSSQDDFWMSSHVYHAWEETQSVFAAVKRAFENAVWLWQTWDGCFLSMFIGCMPPLAFHEDYYKFTFVIIAGALIVALMAFLFVLLVRVCKFDIWHYLIITPIMLFIFMNMIPSAKEAFYWWVGGINYTLFFAVFLIAQAFVLEFMVSKRIVFLILGTILSFCTGLGNLLSGLLCPIVLVLELIVYLFIHKKKGLIFLAPVIAGIAGLLCNVLAPGNLIRGGDTLFAASPFEAIWGTIVASTDFIKYFYKKPMIILIIVMAVVIFDGFSKSKLGFKFKYPLIFVALSYLVYCAVFTPVVYAGSAYYGRCQNISFGAQMIMYLVNIIYLSGWLHGKFVKLNADKAKLIKHILIYPLTVLAVVLCVTNQEGLHFFSAKTSLEIGQAQDFDRRVDERFAIYYNDDIKDVEVSSITWIPPIFYWDDQCIGEMEFYFHKNSVKLVD